MEASGSRSRPGSGRAPGGEHGELLQQFIDGVVDYAIFALDPDGRISTWNAGAERLKGYTAAEIAGRHFSTFYTADDVASGKPGRALAIAAAEGRFGDEGWRVRADGSLFWASVTITAIRGPDGRLLGFGKVTRDLTERKHNEDALRGVLARERQAAAQLRHVDRLRTELVAVIAHDLRAPVGVLQELLALLRRDWASLDDDQRLELVDRMTKRADILGSLVDDVFDLARIEAGELHVDAVVFDLEAVVGQVIADAQAASPDREVTLQATTATRVLGDERRTWQVLSNLVSNALKFSPEDQPVDITVEDRDDEVVVSIADRGPGIPEDQRSQLFRAFVRLPQSVAQPGSGVGLYIAKSLVEAQGGRIWFESVPGAGSTFRFSLPSRR